MHIIIGLSDLPLIRSRLHEYLDIKTSLLAEAFAAGLGHVSQAAALTTLAAREGANTHPLDTLPFDLAAFSARLESLGVAYEHQDGLSAYVVAGDALRRAGVVDEGPSFETRYEDALAKMDKRRRSPMDEFTKSGLREVEKFCAIAGTLDWRMNKTGWLLDWFREWGQPFGLRLHRRLAAACDRHADLDPDMAAFLSDAMEALDSVFLVREGDSPKGCLAGGQLPSDDDDDDELDERAFAPFKAADSIYSTFNARIVRFFDKVCRRWDAADDILVMEPSWPSPSRGRSSGRSPTAIAMASIASPKAFMPQYGGITVGLTEHARKCRFAISDTGEGEVNKENACGLVAFALWRSGVPAAEVSNFGIEADDAYVNVADVIRRWVNLDGNAHVGGEGASRKVLMRLCHPDGLPKRLDRDESRRRFSDEEVEDKARRATSPPVVLVDNQEFLSVLDNPAGMARLLRSTGEKLEGMMIDKNGGGAWLIGMNGSRMGSRTIPVPPADIAQAIVAWLRGCRKSTPFSVGQAQAYVPAGPDRFRVSLHEGVEHTYFAVRAIQSVLTSDSTDCEEASDLKLNYYPMLPFGEVPEGHELHVLQERSVVVSQVSHPHTVAAAENLVLRGLMREVATPDMGYGRRRFDASQQGMRLLVHLRRS